MRIDAGKLNPKPPPTSFYFAENQAAARELFVKGDRGTFFNHVSTEAQRGTHEYQALMAWLYLNRWTLNEDHIDRSLAWAEKSLDGEGGFALWVYSWALLESEDFANGIVYMIKSAELDFPPALYHLAAFFWHGAGVPQDTDTGLQLYNRAAGLGHINSKIMMHDMKLRGWLGRWQQTWARLTSPIAPGLRLIRWFFFTEKFAGLDMSYLPAIRVANSIRRASGDTTVRPDLEERVRRLLSRGL